MQFRNVPLLLLFVASLPLPLLAEDPFQALVRPTEAMSAAEEQTKFRVPPGFTVQLVASEPMINKPINMAFDAKGRLWVTSNTEYPFPAEKDRWEDASGTKVKGSRDAIKILEDTNGDGAADKATDFVDGLNIPIGVLPYGQGCIAWSIPNIWYFADTNGDGKCDQRKILFGPLGYEKDTHGNIASLRLGEDGWIYATHGFSNTSHFEVRPENLHGRKVGDPGTTLDLQSGNVFRFKPDGSAVEIWSRGQVNPFGLCWDAWGNLYSADCHSNPLTQLIHQACYPSFGKPDDGLGFGPVLCPHSHGSTGLCGVLYLEGGRWGTEWNDRMLLGNCVTSKINLDTISYTGATPHANEQPDFLTCDDPWFRPVDLKFGPDNSLYVADFYNKIIGHYEVDRKHPGRDRERGRIWRISKAGAMNPSAPTEEQKLSQEWRWKRSSQVVWSEQDHDAAVAIVQNANAAPQLRRIVAETLISHPHPRVVAPLLAVLQQVEAADASLRLTLRIALRNCLAQPNAFANLPDGADTMKEISSLVRGIDTPEASAWQLKFLVKNPPDRDTLLKSLGGIAKNLPDARQAELVTLVKQQFGADDATQLELLQTLLKGVAQRGSKPGSEVAAWATGLAERLLTELTGPVQAGWSGDVATFGMDKRNGDDGGEISVISSLPPPRSQAVEVLTGTLRSQAFACPAKLSFWLCGHNGFPGEAEQKKNFVRLVEAADQRELQRTLPPRNDTARKVEWDLNAHVGKMVRLEIIDGDNGKAYAWLALGRMEPAVVPMTLGAGGQRWQLLAELVSSLKLDQFAEPLAKAFTGAELSDAVRNAIAQALQRFPEKKDLLVGLFKTASTRQQSVLAEVLVSTNEGAKKLCEMAPPRLLTQPNIASKLAALNDAALNKRIAELTKDLPPASAELDALLAARLKGFLAAQASGAAKAEAGQAVFQANCANCHQLAGKGAVVGPQLDGTKNRGAERLCEDILDPNRAVDPVFHLHILKLKDNSVLAGLQRREEGATLVLADAAGQEHRVEKSSITENTESALSLMPAAFGQSIPEADFYHLLAYLLKQ